MIHTFYLKIGTFSLLCILSILAHLFIDKYFEVGEELLANRDFVEGVEGWEINAIDEEGIVIDRGEVKIQSMDDEYSPNITQRLPVEILGETVKLKVKAKSVNISKGEKSRHKARILFIQYRQGKPIYRVSHELASFAGTFDWKPYSKVFHIQPGVSEAKITLLLNRVSGELYCKEVSLFQVTANPVYTLAKWTLMSAWFVFTFILLGPVIFAPGATGWFKPALTILVIVCIALGTTIPGAIKNNLKSDLIKEVRSYSEAVSVPVIDTTKTMVGKVTTSKSAVDITKWAHFGMFGLLTFLLLWQTTHPKPYMILFNVLMLACGTEMVQLFAEGRGATLSDVAVDMTGSTAGLLLWLVVRKYLGSRLEAETPIGKIG